MDIKQLKNLMGQVQKSFAAAGVKDAAREIKKFANALPGEDSASADDVLQNLETELNDNSRKFESRAHNSGVERVRTRTPTDDIVVEDYVRQLIAADTNSETFERVFESMKKDRAAKKAEVDSIAHGYVKGPERYKTKAKAQDAIRARFIELIRAENEMHYLEEKKVTPW